jgi:hypothetical protein
MLHWGELRSVWKGCSLARVARSRSEAESWQRLTQLGRLRTPNRFDSLKPPELSNPKD